MRLLSVVENVSTGCLVVAIAAIAVALQGRQASGPSRPDTLPVLPTDAISLKRGVPDGIGVILFASLPCERCPGMARALEQEFKNADPRLQFEVRFRPHDADDRDGLRIAAAAQCGIESAETLADQLSFLADVGVVRQSLSGQGGPRSLESCIDGPGRDAVAESVTLAQKYELPRTPVFWMGRVGSPGMLSVHYQIVAPDGFRQALVYLRDPAGRQ